MGWYGGQYAKSKKPNKSINITTNAAILESLYYKKVGNFFYAKNKKLYQKIALHRYDLKNKYYLQSSQIELRYDASKVMSGFLDKEQMIRIEYQDKNFVVNVGIFDTQEEIETYVKEKNINTNDFNITQGDINSKNFLLSNQYYKYDYHIPYTNKNIDKVNFPFQTYMKKVSINKKQKVLKKNSSKKSKPKGKHSKQNLKQKKNSSKNPIKH